MVAPTGFGPILLESESSILPIILRSSKVVVSQGFAPRLSPSKGDVLLLHHETAKAAGFACGCLVHDIATLFPSQEKGRIIHITLGTLNPICSFGSSPWTLVISPSRKIYPRGFCFGKKSQVCFSQNCSSRPPYPSGDNLVVLLNPVVQSLKSPLAIGRTGQA